MDDKINSTKPMPKAGPLALTLDEMDEYDMNKLNDQGRASTKGK